MTNTQHTPGPWLARDGLILSQSKRSDDTGDHFDWTYPRVLAEVTDDWDQAANARLIAAAPDLLAALKHIEWAVTGFGDFEAQYPDALAAVRAAIAKATGQ